MPITPTYPGIYIQELPSSAHTITGAETNIAVFIGYTHPFQTKQFGKAIRVTSFTDFERNFGGLFRLSPDVAATSAPITDVADAVFQFFQNGGTKAYVVGLKPQTSTDGKTFTDLAPPAAKFTDDPGIVFTSRVLTDAGRPMSIEILNAQPSDPVNKKDTLDIADIRITYGNQAETHRKVSLDPKLDGRGNPMNPNFITNRLGTPSNPISALVTVPEPELPPKPAAPVAAPAPAPPPAAPPAAPPAPAPLNNYPLSFKANKSGDPGKFDAAVTKELPIKANVADFQPVFDQDSSLDKLPIFNLLILPGVTEPVVLEEALSFSERKQAFLIMDPPKVRTANQADINWIGNYATDATLPKSPNGALYFPYLQSPDPLTGDILELPPSGFVAGVYCRTDDDRGVWKAPAGLETLIHGTTGVVETGTMNDMGQGSLNPLGVNCLRQFPIIGTVVFGARTLTTFNEAFRQWRYVPVRRMALFLEQTLYRNLGWVVFEPNDEPLWVSIRTSIEAFMLALFHQGAFQGSKPSDAFQVKCDASTTTPQDQDNGIVNIIVAFAPLKPAEFVIVKIAQLAGQTQA